MITFFSIPRAFTGGNKTRQENALGSWAYLDPRPEIILFCDDPGVAEAAERFDCIHVPDVRRSNDGVPYVGDAFRLASQMATNDILCFANTDVLFFQDLIAAVGVIDREFDEPYLAIGRRWDVGVPELLEFSDGWQARMKPRMKHLHAPSAMDYFIYSKGSIVGLPDFVIGSPRWDNWVVANAKRRALNVIDTTEAITCVHQTHKHVWPAEGITYNRRMWETSGGGLGYTHSGSWVLLANGELKKLRSEKDYDRCLKVANSPDIWMVRESSMTRVRIDYWGAYVAMGKPGFVVVGWQELSEYKAVGYFQPD